MEDAALVLVDFRAGEAIPMRDRRRLDFHFVQFLPRLDFLKVQWLMAENSSWRGKTSYWNDEDHEGKRSSLPWPRKSARMRREIL